MNEYETQVRKFYSEIWNSQNYAEIPNVLHKDITFRGSLGIEKAGHSGFREYVEYVHACLGNYHCRVEDMVAQSGKVFAKMKFSGLHHAEFLGFAPTFHEVAWAGAALFTFAGNKVANLWVLGDLKGLELQLGNQT